MRPADETEPSCQQADRDERSGDLALVRTVRRAKQAEPDASRIGFLVGHGADRAARIAEREISSTSGAAMRSVVFFVRPSSYGIRDPSGSSSIHALPSLRA